jgi:hypothetical protein
MQIKTWLLAIMTSAALVAALLGCEPREHPRPDEEAAADQPLAPSEPLAEGERELDPATEQCVEVVSKIMSCSTQQPFNAVLLGDGGAGVPGLSVERMQEMVEFWQEPGGRARTCEQVLEDAQSNDLQQPQTRQSLLEATEEECVDFGEYLVDTDAMEALTRTEGP